jgi:hypothetical protein
MNIYGDLDYARSRLIETIVLLKTINEPVRVDNIQRRTEVLVTPLNIALPQQWVRLDDLDINPVKLGYINLEKESYYISRTPMRRDWRQGLRVQGLRTPDGRSFNCSAIQLAKTIKGDYPKLRNCFNPNNNPFIPSPNSIAFSRDFAVQKSNLWFKGIENVGEISPDKSFKLHPKFDWVRELLEEELEAA